MKERETRGKKEMREERDIKERWREKWNSLTSPCKVSDGAIMKCVWKFLDITEMRDIVFNELMGIF